MAALSALDRAFINQFQGGLPLHPRPFNGVAARLGCSEVTLIQTVERLLAERVLSRFGPLFDAQSLGGGLTLAALHAPETRFDAIAETVNALPEVAHNYRRDHRLNMWFVVATDHPEAVGTTLDRIREHTGLTVLDFPKRREFYLGLWLRIGDHGEVDTVPAPDSPRSREPTTLSALDRRLIAATQAGLPLHPEPYAEVAADVGCEPEQVIERLQHLLVGGAIRRIGAVPNHYRLGLRANGMSVWELPTERLAELGQRVGALPWVSHCCERPPHRPLWPYNLFAMVHGRERDDVHRKVAQIAKLLGGELRDHQVLFSSAILKKTGLRLAA